jgi:hypothetical protein
VFGGQNKNIIMKNYLIILSWDFCAKMRSGPNKCWNNPKANVLLILFLRLHKDQDFRLERENK